MATRYVYWRTPKGLPYRGVDGKHGPTALLAQLGESASINDQGQVQWKGFSVQRLEPGIRALVVVVDGEGNELNETDAWSIVRPTIATIIKSLGGGKAVVPSDVLKRADARAADHFRKNEEHFTIRTSLSVKEFPKRRISVGSSSIGRLTRSDVQRLARPRSFNESRDSAVLEEECRRAGYQPIRIDVVGRTRHEAIDRGLDAAHLLRGVWTLFSSAASWTIRFGRNAPEALGGIRLGPVHTLHRSDGTPEDDAYWYEPKHSTSRRPFSPDQGWSKIENNRRWAFAKLKRLPHRREVESLLSRYADALDFVDHDIAFLHMWSLLERMTDTIGANYDDTISRATWTFTDAPVAKEILDALRLYRNRYVHAARSGSSPDQLVYAIKQIVDRHLINLMRNDFGVTSIEEYGAFLAQPRDVERLREIRRRVSKAIAIRVKWHTPTPAEGK